ncbi:MAG: sodium/solute symporter [Nitrospinae bacterium]|nr:sodium/solute symporter [Nitrospinota bacterium]
MNVSLHPIDFGILLLYTIGIVAHGIWVGKRHKGENDYFLAGRTMTWTFIGMSLFASNISSTTLIGLAGEAYSTGIAVYNYEWMAAVVLVFFSIFLLPLYLNSGIYTVPEFLEKRYDSRCRSYFSALTLFLNIFVDTAGTLYAGGLIIRMVFPDLPLWEAVVSLALLSGIYTAFGGLAAVMFTDMVQAILLLVASVIVTFCAFEQAGGWSQIVASTPPDMLSLVRPIDDPSVPWLGLITGVPLLGFYFWCTNQFMTQRVLSAKNIEEGRRGVLFAGLLKLPVLFIMVLPGTAAILIYPELPKPDLVYPTLLFDLLPTGILGLALAGFLAALMSQVDSTLNSASTLLTMDFLKKYRPQMSSYSLMQAGRIFTLLFMGIAVLWAPMIENFDSLFQYLQKILSYAVTPVVTLFLVGIFWKRANAAGGVFALWIGTFCGVTLFVLNEVFGVISLHFLYIPPLIFCMTLPALFMGSMRTEKPDAQQMSLCWDISAFRKETVEMNSLPWHKNYRILSVILLLLTSILLMFFW